MADGLIKRCCACGSDLAQVKRVRTGSGDYLCRGCYFAQRCAAFGFTTCTVALAALPAVHPMARFDAASRHGQIAMDLLHEALRRDDPPQRLFFPPDEETLAIPEKWAVLALGILMLGLIGTALVWAVLT